MSDPRDIPTSELEARMQAIVRRQLEETIPKLEHIDEGISVLIRQRDAAKAERDALRVFAVRAAVAVASEGCEDIAASLTVDDLPALAEVIEGMASPSPVSEGVEMEETRRALAEARAEIAVLEWERDDAREGVTAWGRARDVAEARRVALQSVVDRLTRENARLTEERDTLRAEVERLKALTHARVLSCPDCEWSGQEADLIEKMSGALCPSCYRVLIPKGGLRVSVAVEDSP